MNMSTREGKNDQTPIVPQASTSIHPSIQCNPPRSRQNHSKQLLTSLELYVLLKPFLLFLLSFHFFSPQKINRHTLISSTHFTKSFGSITCKSIQNSATHIFPPKPIHISYNHHPQRHSSLSNMGQKLVKSLTPPSGPPTPFLKKKKQQKD